MDRIIIINEKSKGNKTVQSKFSVVKGVRLPPLSSTAFLKSKKSFNLLPWRGNFSKKGRILHLISSKFGGCDKIITMINTIRSR